MTVLEFRNMSGEIQSISKSDITQLKAFEWNFVIMSKKIES